MKANKFGKHWRIVVRLSLPLVPVAFAMSFDKSPHKASRNRHFEKKKKHVLLALQELGLSLQFDFSRC